MCNPIKHLIALVIVNRVGVEILLGGRIVFGFHKELFVACAQGRRMLSSTLVAVELYILLQDRAASGCCLGRGNSGCQGFIPKAKGVQTFTTDFPDGHGSGLAYR